MRPLISVIIPNYNNSKYIAEAIDSIRQQDYENYEIIIVDDGSTDNSIEVILNMEFPLTLIKSENYGAGSARNIGILAARGDFVALLDSDDVWKKEKLSRQMELMLDEELDLVYCSGEFFGNIQAKTKLISAKYKGDCYPYYKKYPSRSIIVLPCSGSVFRKSVLHKSGLFDVNVPPPTEDWDFFRRFSRYAKVGFCEEILVSYRVHENNVSARSVIGYFNGNTHAITKMFIEDSKIGFIERRIIWAKFHFLSAKSLLKNHFFARSMVALLRIVLPILR
jgi:glycosyltransferase involved in cell wall biosynthesis